VDRFVTQMARLDELVVVFVDAILSSPFERFFFLEPVNGYFFEVIDNVRQPR
jgi:hypothetical protein